MRLTRQLDPQHSLVSTSYFPALQCERKGFRYRVVLGVGGNIGDMPRRLERLWVHLGRIPRIKRVQSGPILRNPPFGFTEQADFHNTVIEIATSLQPRALLRLVWRIEKRFGRKRSFPNAPRTLDLDIIFFENRVVRSTELMIPHPEWGKRPSVTIPLRHLPQKRKTVRR
jgi:2-amino-4-hydroxy-6-hydroxymethyldihydropteridine diphosphokinase